MHWWKRASSVFKGREPRKVVLTYLFGGYDTLKDPSLVTPGWDYFCVSDTGHSSEVWRPVLPDDSLLNVKDPKRRASLVKIAHHQYIGYPYEKVLTIDASMRINCNLDDFLAEFYPDDCDMLIARHPVRRCLYEEADAVIQHRFDDQDIVREQMTRYRDAGFPVGQGLFGTRMMVKSNGSEALRSMCGIWAEEYMAGSRRDQLSLTYAIWRHRRLYGRGSVISAFDFEEVYHRRKLFEIHTHLGSPLWR